MREKPILAFLYDFDKTLCTTDMQDYSFIPKLGMAPADFWAEVNAFARENQMDQILAYLYMMIQKSKENRQSIRREDFVRLGKDVTFYPGVENWFDRINAYAESIGAVAEHYIVSSGQKEIIEGSAIGSVFSKIYACEYYYDENGVAVWPKVAVNYTGKTQFLFRINKGVLEITEDRALNRVTPEQQRRVPFRHMIYLGDGMTDVPCMKLVQLKGGHSIAVYPPDGNEKARQTSNQLILDNRVKFAVEADYREGSALDRLIKQLMMKICFDASLLEEHAKQRQAAMTEQES